MNGLEFKKNVNVYIMKKLIAVVDDEQDILQLVSLNLEKAGYRTVQCEDANDLMQILKQQTPDLIVLDLMLPDMDGFDICKNLKMDTKYHNIPIIMLTARGDETDRVLGLEFGADDYIVKPFSPRELTARVKAVLRRIKTKQAKTHKVVEISNLLRIDLDKFEVTVDQEKVNLTSTEFKILKLLVERLGWVYSRNQILDYLWGNEKIVLDRTIDVHIKNLREKLGIAGKLIKNIRGVGYKLEETK